MCMRSRFHGLLLDSLFQVVSSRLPHQDFIPTAQADMSWPEVMKTEQDNVVCVACVTYRFTT